MTWKKAASWRVLCKGRQSVVPLTLKAPITTAADDIHKYFFIVFQRNKT